MSEARRLRLEVTGAVQGVGFRPHVYRLATSLGLAGWVLNDARGVLLEVEGDAAAVERFAATLAADPPPRARVLSTRREVVAPTGERGFDIRHSDRGGAATVFVLPDLAVCPRCAGEVDDPGDRRHRYPFTNCTDCGPRLTIVEALPYDRPATTMAGFVMCERCQREYDDPADRRFHAQPNACPRCGPRVALVAPDGATLAEDDAAIDEAAAVVRSGGVLAVLGLGGFHLVVDATDRAAVATLRARKRRPDKPLAVMVKTLDEARRVARLEPEDEAALAAPSAPILLVPPRVDPDAVVLADNVAPDAPTVGLMLAPTPLHRLLCAAVARPIVATSGNLVDEPICTAPDEACRRLGAIADRLLVHDRPIARPVDDSLAWRVAGEVRLLRRARGFAPLPIELPRALPSVLALGGHQKATVALTLESHAFASQHLGDLGTLESQRAFERAATDLLTLYRGRPLALARDLHPDYASSLWAERAARGDAGPAAQVLAGLPRVLVQHHHAHLAAVLAEHGLDGRALGLTWDGSGDGGDGTVWGGEALVGDVRAAIRVASLEPFLLPGGEAAIRDPRRVALALATASGVAFDALESADRHRFDALVARRVGPLTTSMGRLFDGVAALLGVCGRASYEGQAAVRLEAAVDPSERGAYALPPGPVGADGVARLDWRPLVAEVVADHTRGVPVGVIAARFHRALADAAVAIARAVGEPRVALAGGCFQNRVLVEGTAERLRAAGFEVLLPRELPPNDGALSVGQAVVAAARLEADGAGTLPGIASQRGPEGRIRSIGSK